MAESRYSGRITATYEFCPERYISIDTFFVEEGSWTLIDKNKILFQPKDGKQGKQYECEIVDLNKTFLKLDCHLIVPVLKIVL